MFSISLYTVLYAIAFLFAVSVQAGEFYKWVDEDGNTHYSQNPPSHQKSTLIKTYSDKSSQTTTKQSLPLTPKIAEKKSQQVATKDKGLCQQARENIKVLSNRPMVMQEGKLLSIEEKNKQINAAQKIADIHC